MKKFFGLILSIAIILSSQTAFADGDLWDNYGDQNFYGAEKAVSDEDFDKAIESKKGNKPKKMKGESYQESNETEVINQIPKELPVICISTPLQITDKAVLPVGHYQVVGEKRNNKIYLKLYQAHYLMAELEATETFDDYGEPEIHFVKLITDNDNKLKIIYGSIDFNAYAIVTPAQTGLDSNE